MKCNDPDIKELLPPYLSRELDRDGRERVVAHLSLCEDCRGDISLLQIMSQETVPDPGDDFWIEMPRRIRREIQTVKHSKARWGIDQLRGKIAFPGWSWGMATVAAVILAVSILVLKPAPHPGDQNDEVSAYIQAVSGHLELSDLDQAELEHVSSWTDRELVALDEDILDGLANIQKKDVHEELSELEYRDLKQLSDKLEEDSEQEA